MRRSWKKPIISGLRMYLICLASYHRKVTRLVESEGDGACIGWFQFEDEEDSMRRSGKIKVPAIDVVK
jgi:hypothetical protein